MADHLTGSGTELNDQAGSGAELDDLARSGAGLEFDAEAQRTLAAATFDFVENFFAEMRKPEHRAYDSNTEESDQVFSLEIGSSPHPLSTILGAVSAGVVGPGVATASGRHFGQIPSGGIPSAAMADFLAASTNKHPAIRTSSPGAVNVETAVLRWVAGLFGFDKDSFGGCLTSGGSMGNVIAFAAARDAAKLKGSDYERNVIYAPTTTHYCIEKGLRFLGLCECPYRKIDVDENQRILTDELEKQMLLDVDMGLTPFLVIGCAGTTNTGAIDDLRRLSSLSRQFGAWFHVDAAYGGFFVLVDEIKEKMAGIEDADSIVVDPHKGLNLPFGIGIFIVKNVADLLCRHRCSRRTATYIDYTEDDRSGDNSQTGSRHIPDENRWAPADVSPELTRDFRGLRMWLPLLYHGTKVFEDVLKEKLYLARDLYSRLKSLPDVEVGPSPQLSVVIFRFIRNGVIREEDDDVDDAEIILAKDDSSPPENDAENNDNLLGGKNISNYHLLLPEKSASYKARSSRSEVNLNDDRANERIVSDVTSDGTVYLTTIVVSGLTWIRLAILSFRSHKKDIDLALRLILDARAKLLSRAREKRQKREEMKKEKDEGKGKDEENELD